MYTEFGQFCSSTYLPLSFHPWWLNAVCGPGNWGVCLSTDAGGSINGVLPWFRTRRWGLPVILQPPFTSYGGPWFVYPNDPGFKASSRPAYEKKICDALIRQLPRVVYFRQNFRPEIANHLPFYWAGFKQTTRYTYIFDDCSDLSKIQEGFKASLRTYLRKSENLIHVTQENDADSLLYELNQKSYERKQNKQPYSFNIFHRLHLALTERNQAACLVARDAQTNLPHAALYLAFDARQAAVLLTGIDPANRSSGALQRLFVEAIRFAAERNLSFDFEGSMHPGIEHSFRAFGARLTPYHQVWRWGIPATG